MAVPTAIFRSQESLFIFRCDRGRPRGRSVDLVTSRLDVDSIHVSLPNGLPRSRLQRTASISFSFSGSFTHFYQLGSLAIAARVTFQALGKNSLERVAVGIHLENFTSLQNNDS